MRKTYKVYDPDTMSQSEAEEFAASSSGCAAEEFVEGEDGHDCEPTEVRTVMVAEVGSDEWQHFSVTCEVTVQYHAVRNEVTVQYHATEIEEEDE